SAAKVLTVGTRERPKRCDGFRSARTRDSLGGKDRVGATRKRPCLAYRPRPRTVGPAGRPPTSPSRAQRFRRRDEPPRRWPWRTCPGAGSRSRSAGSTAGPRRRGHEALEVLGTALAVGRERRLQTCESRALASMAAAHLGLGDRAKAL